MKAKIFFALVAFIMLLSSCKQTNEQLIQEAIELSNKNQYQKAIKIYSTVIKNNKKLQLPYYNRGLCYRHIKDNFKAFNDFNKVLSMQTYGDFIITYNQETPFTNEETQLQVPYNDAFYQRAQVKFYLDSLKSAFDDFDLLVLNNYFKKSNCILWQGTIALKEGDSSQACKYFEKAKMFALTEDEIKEVEEIPEINCSQVNPNRK